MARKDVIMRDCEYWSTKCKDQPLMLNYSAVVELNELLKELDEENRKVMISCGDLVIPGNKMPPNNSEAEVAYAIFTEMIMNGHLSVSSEPLHDGKTRVHWELKKSAE